MGLNLVNESRRLRLLEAYSERYGYRPEQPLRIHTLGRFSVLLRGQPLDAARARQQKPLELLQAVIALGGRGVSVEPLANALWPDAEGDAATNAFDVTLHRLRKLIDIDSALVTSGGHLSLNNRRVWVDVWAFERLLNEADRLLTLSRGKAVSEHVERLLDQALSSYQDGFLAREPVRSWNLSPRERLRSKLLRHILDIGQVSEHNGHWRSAIRFYQKGLEIEPLAEALYQRLMICYLQTGRCAEGLAVYQRCRANLSTLLQISPSAQTESIRTSLLA